MLAYEITKVRNCIFIPSTHIFWAPATYPQCDRSRKYHDEQGKRGLLGKYIVVQTPGWYIT